jgi:hypothetical protein
MDYCVMHASWSSWPEWIYRYWMALGVVVVVFGASLSYSVWSLGARRGVAIATFSTVILLFVGGFLDIFYAVITILQGEPYSFDVWSAQYKLLVMNGILPSWTWTDQIIWTSIFLVAVFLMWRFALKRKR